MRLELDDWTAQEPPRDFAERTVEAMLANGQEQRPRTLGRHWLGGVLLAAALVGTTAWATLGRQSSNEAPPAPVQRSHLRAPASPTAPPPRQEPAPKNEPEPPPPPSIPPALSAPPRASASAEPLATPPPFVRVPRCECQPGAMMCACLE